MVNLPNMKKLVGIQIILIIVLGVMLFVYVRSATGKQPTVALVSQSALKMSNVGNTTTVSFINPAVTADLGKHYIINFKDLRQKYLDIQKTQKQKTFVYFAYLNNSSWIGLGEKEFFPAASTIKVPLAMAMYRMEEQGRLKLDQTYTLTELDLNTQFGELYKVGADKSFTIEELISIMLQYSDNTAMEAVIHIAELVGIKDPLKDVYAAMGWEYTSLGSATTYIDINLKTLSNMFIALYNASYVSIEHSQDILGYLSRTLFNDSITAGVPDSIPVAHKIGVNDEVKAYSDCGLVYAPSRYYILCMGSVGAEPAKANDFMKQISQATYDFVIHN